MNTKKVVGLTVGLAAAAAATAFIVYKVVKCLGDYDDLDFDDDFEDDEDFFEDSDEL